MLRRATRALLLSFVVFAALSATSAFAAAPQANPVVLKNYTFETATAADQGDFYSFNTYRGGGAGSYWWGRSAGHGHTGYGLWCAASGTPAVAYGSVPTAYTTAGEADFAMTDTTGWYKSDLSFWYKFPGTINIYTDQNPLSVSWFDSSNQPHTGVPNSYIVPAVPISSAWTQVVENRTGGAGNMPAAQGTVKFDYIDLFVPAGGGAGATIDDVQATGYKYGPPRNVAAARVANSGPTSTTVNVTWSAPYAAANNTVVDTRAITYHVYRYEVFTGTYTEIGSGYPSTGPLTATDTSARVDSSLRYYVQAVDPANSAYWGQAANPAVDVPNLTSPYGAIQGVVTGNGGAPVAGASVNVVGGITNTIVQTDVNGAYSVAGLLPGTYSVGVTSATGYNTQTVPSASVTAGAITTENFALTPLTFGITPSFVPGGGGVISPGTATLVPYGTNQTFDIIPDPGYQISSLTVDGVAQTAPLPTSYTFTNVKAVHTISATFAITTFNVTWSISGVSHGTVSPPSPQTVGYGSKVPTFTITSNAGYEIKDVVADGQSMGNLPTVGEDAIPAFAFANANHTIVVSWQTKTWTITPTFGAHGSATIASLPFAVPRQLTAGGTYFVVITPDAGYKITDVTVDGVSQGSTYTNPYSYTFPTLAADHTIGATFAPISVTQYAVTSSVSGGNGTISPSGTQQVSQGANSTAFTITPNTGYHVADVVLDGTTHLGAVTSYAGFTNVQAPHAIVASFAANTASSYTITPSAGANGSIAPNSATIVPAGGSQIVTITANPGYHIASITVDGNLTGLGTNASQYVYTLFTNLNNDHTIAATFAVNSGPTFPITVTQVPNGTITPGTTSVSSGSSLTFTLTPATGYHVSNVIVDGTSLGSSYYTSPYAYPFTNVTASHTITGAFAANAPVHRFRNLKNGFYLLSADPNEWNTINTTLYKTWTDEGVAYTINTTNPLNSSPLWRFRNIKGGNYLYSADPVEKASIIANLSKTWFYEGPTYNVDRTFAASGKTVDRFINRKNGTYLYSADPAEQTTIINTLSATWKLEGPAFYLAP